jgi:glucose/mannose-6-phosphate isomerase
MSSPSPALDLSLDRAGMIGRIVGLPQQMRDAWAQAKSTTLPPSHANASAIVICGMGGSAIGGDIARTLVEGELDFPLLIVRGYDLPGFVDRDTLVILSSYSGNTEETLAACDRALEAGARTIAVTTGGVLAQRAAASGFPLLQFHFQGQPREAIGYSSLLMLGVLTQLGYVRDYSDQIAAAADLLESMAANLGPTGDEGNAARMLAARCLGRIVAVYGGGLMAEVARRWKGQLNENGKTWAFFDQLPELNHNAVLGFRFPEGVARQLLVVMLSAEGNHPRIRLRERVTTELLESSGIEVEPVEAQGSGKFEQVFSALYLGDFVSYYLALANGVDPSDNAAIDQLKAHLARGA